MHDPTGRLAAGPEGRPVGGRARRDPDLVHRTDAATAGPSEAVAFPFGGGTHRDVLGRGARRSAWAPSSAPGAWAG